MSAFDSFFDDDDYVVNMSHQNGNWVVTKNHSEWKNLGFRYFQDLPGNQQVYDLEATLFPEYQHIWKSVLSIPIDNTDDETAFHQIFTDEKEIEIFIQILYYLHVLNFDCYFEKLDMKNPKHFRFMWLMTDKPNQLYNAIEDDFDLIKQVNNLTLGNNNKIAQKRLQRLYVSSQRYWFMSEDCGDIEEHKEVNEIHISKSKEYNDHMSDIIKCPNVVVSGSYAYYFINNLPIPDSSDIDIFIMNNDIDTVRNIIEQIFYIDTEVIITKLGYSVICINSPHLYRTIQLILTGYHQPHHVVLNFDLPCCQWFIYMTKCYSTKAARHTHKHKLVYVGHSILLVSRQIKYLKRGFKLFEDNERVLDSDKFISFTNDEYCPPLKDESVRFPFLNEDQKQMDVGVYSITSRDVDRLYLKNFDFGGNYGSNVSDTKFEMKDVIIPNDNNDHRNSPIKIIYIDKHNPNHTYSIGSDIMYVKSQYYIYIKLIQQTKVYLNGERVFFHNLNFPCKANIVFCKISDYIDDVSLAITGNRRWIPYIIRVDDINN